jgi:hypothetical protein
MKAISLRVRLGAVGVVVVDDDGCLVVVVMVVVVVGKSG